MDSMKRGIMNNNLTPRYLSKYKSLDSNVDWLVESLKENKLYFPNRHELNDPFECPNIGLTVGVPGMGIDYSLHKYHGIIEGWLGEYKILSLSDSGVNPVMWAHYANNYGGICLMFENKGSFNECEEVKYEVLPRESHSIEFELSDEHKGCAHTQILPDETIRMEL